MGFVCPRCERATLEIVEAVELGPGPDDDERTIQTIRCSGCQLTGAAEYRESRRGSLDSDCYTHDGCVLDAAGEDALRLWFASSPRPPIDGVTSLTRPVSWFRMRYVP